MPDKSKPIGEYKTGPYNVQIRATLGAIEKFEKKETRAEIVLVKDAIEAFSSVGGSSYLFQNVAIKEGVCSVSDDSYDRFLEKLNETEIKLLTLKKHGTNVIALAKTIVTKAMRARGRKGATAADVLIADELVLIEFANGILNKIKEIIDLLQQVRKVDKKAIRTVNYVTPADVNAGKKLRENLTKIWNHLSQLSNNLLDLYKLETKIDKEF